MDQKQEFTPQITVSSDSFFRVEVGHPDDERSSRNCTSKQSAVFVPSGENPREFHNCWKFATHWDVLTQFNATRLTC